MVGAAALVRDFSCWPRLSCCTIEPSLRRRRPPLLCIFSRRRGGSRSGHAHRLCVGVASVVGRSHVRTGSLVENPSNWLLDPSAPVTFWIRPFWHRQLLESLVAQPTSQDVSPYERIAASRVLGRMKPGERRKSPAAARSADAGQRPVGKLSACGDIRHCAGAARAPGVIRLLPVERSVSSTRDKVQGRVRHPLLGVG